MLLAIESSCDETAVAVFDIKSYLSGDLCLSQALSGHLIQSQVSVHEEYGGVVPELAAREHLKNLGYLAPEILTSSGFNFNNISHVAVTIGPGLKGCLLVGLAFAKGISTALNIPLIPINHLEGHLLSVLLSCEVTEDIIFPSIFLLVSGGHTQIVYCTNTNGEICYRLLATTQDDAAGEAFDKIGTLIGLPYPSGANISKLAEKGNNSVYSLPTCATDDPAKFSFSGLKTAASRLIKVNGEQIIGDPQGIADFSFAVESAIVRALSEKVEWWISYYRSNNIKLGSIIVSGGVAANLNLRKSLADISDKNCLPLLIPEMKFCTDNAAMIGAAALFRMKNLNSVFASNPYSFINCSAEARFPLELLNEYYKE
ncbi:MAG TPA: tRNA (adenosine(37)-N6)-threonylcarbamoyltransferase complex transferase subunit TsaD [Oligoflexia bacterium]|nr:tRNA (adenosine(37)-N6)-threonylcarbamoyltransferase complex transferase subunit TsaD [Oligoflexia bacterium]HMP48659.1 tRNA (adenosine(37)-N6)-threonylcarbamoyltransferase complex transferase subunit TsaD [Oligoflexia bacterium]